MSGNPVSSTHPLLPPTSEDDRVHWLRLLRSWRVGPSTFYRLMGEHGSAAAALEALPSVAAAAGVDTYRPCAESAARNELAAGQRAGARLVARGEPDYPSMLQDLDDAPPLLWAIGDLGLLRRPCVALVGARNSSSLGTRMSRALARELGEAGWVVISGLARGIDTAAHLASLDTGTVAVVAGGVDVMYPAENTKLAGEIAELGLRLSEQPMGLAPQARHFPKRNRIIAALGRGVVVIEAAAKSGSLITARAALDIGRDVLAVPGHPFDARAAGCNMLIRDGATLVRGAKDVIEALRQLPPPATAEPDNPTPRSDDNAQPPGPNLQEVAALHARILDRLGPSPVAEDQLIRDMRAPAKLVTPALTDLELDGKISRQPGGLVARTM